MLIAFLKPLAESHRKQDSEKVCLMRFNVKKKIDKDTKSWKPNKQTPVLIYE